MERSLRLVCIHLNVCFDNANPNMDMKFNTFDSILIKNDKFKHDVWVSSHYVCFGNQLFNIKYSPKRYSPSLVQK